MPKIELVKDIVGPCKVKLPCLMWVVMIKRILVASHVMLL